MGTYAFFRGDAERQGLQPWNLDPPEDSIIKQDVGPGHKITCDARAGWQLFVASDEEYVEEGQRVVYFDFKGYVEGKTNPPDHPSRRWSATARSCRSRRSRSSSPRIAAMGLPLDRDRDSVVTPATGTDDDAVHAPPRRRLGWAGRSAPKSQPASIDVDCPSGFQHYVPSGEFYDVHAGRVHYYDFQGHIDSGTLEPCEPWALGFIGPRQAPATFEERRAMREELECERAARDADRTDQG